MAESGTVEYRISFVTAGFMLAVAGIADLIQVLLTITGFLAPLSIMVTFLAEGVLFLWFLILRVSYFSGKRAVANMTTIMVATVIELVPIVDGLPSLTMATFALIRNSRLEDRETFAKQKPQ